MADKLIIDGEYDNWRIVWYIEEDGDLGLILGGDVLTPAARKKMITDDPFSKKNISGEMRDHILYTQAALEMGAGLDEHGFIFESRKKASDMLKSIKESAKARTKNRPLPEWAKTALANGWKMPKGWKP